MKITCESMPDSDKIHVVDPKTYRVSIDIEDHQPIVRAYVQDAIECIDDPTYVDYVNAKIEYVRRAFEGSDIHFKPNTFEYPAFRNLNDVFYEFYCTSYTRAQNHIVKRIPYFKDIAWTAETLWLNPFNEVTMCRRDGIRLIIEEWGYERPTT